MKKILYLITQSEFGGAQRYIFDLAVNLKNEFNIEIAFGEQGEEGELAKQLAKAGIKYYTIPHLQRSISLGNDWLALKEIINLFKKTKPDIVHLNSSKISILGSLAGIFSKSKIVYTAHGWVFNEPLGWPMKVFYQLAEKITAKFKDKIICVSEFDYQAAIQKKIAPKNKLAAIHNGIEPIKFLSGKTTARPFQDGQNMVVGSIGNLYKTKGYVYLVQAADILINQEILPLSFFIVGEGEERKILESMIAEFGLTKNITLFGQMSGAAKILPSFDIYVCSSVKEGLSYTLLEAMSAGLPIVATQVGGNSEMIKNNSTGLLVKPQNAKMLAEKIKILFNDQILRQKLGTAAKAWQAEKFSLNKMTEDTSKIYKELL